MRYAFGVEIDCACDTSALTIDAFVAAWQIGRVGWYILSALVFFGFIPCLNPSRKSFKNTLNTRFVSYFPDGSSLTRKKCAFNYKCLFFIPGK